jgi:hypothetical protein
MKTLILILALTLLSSGVASKQEGWGQVVFQNNTSSTGNLLVDGEFGCGPVLAGGFCTTQVRVGNHKLLAKLNDGRSMPDEMEMKQGLVYTLTVGENER